MEKFKTVSIIYILLSLFPAANVNAHPDATLSCLQLLRGASEHGATNPVSIGEKAPRVDREVSDRHAIEQSYQDEMGRSTALVAQHSPPSTLSWTKRLMAWFFGAKIDFRFTTQFVREMRSLHSDRVRFLTIKKTLLRGGLPKLTTGEIVAVFNTFNSWSQYTIDTLGLLLQHRADQISDYTFAQQIEMLAKVNDTVSIYPADVVHGLFGRISVEKQEFVDFIKGFAQIPPRLKKALADEVFESSIFQFKFALNVEEWRQLTTIAGPLERRLTGLLALPKDSQHEIGTILREIRDEDYQLDLLGLAIRSGAKPDFDDAIAILNAFDRDPAREKAAKAISGGATISLKGQERKFLSWINSGAENVNRIFAQDKLFLFNFDFRTPEKALAFFKEVSAKYRKEVVLHSLLHWNIPLDAEQLASLCDLFAGVRDKIDIGKAGARFVRHSEDLPFDHLLTSIQKLPIAVTDAFLKDWLISKAQFMGVKKENEDLLKKVIMINDEKHYFRFDFEMNHLEIFERTLMGDVLDLYVMMQLLKWDYLVKKDPITSEMLLDLLKTKGKFSHAEKLVGQFYEGVRSKPKMVAKRGPRDSIDSRTPRQKTRSAPQTRTMAHGYSAPSTPVSVGSSPVYLHDYSFPDWLFLLENMDSGNLAHHAEAMHGLQPHVENTESSGHLHHHLADSPVAHFPTVEPQQQDLLNELGDLFSGVFDPPGSENSISGAFDFGRSDASSLTSSQESSGLNWDSAPSFSPEPSGWSSPTEPSSSSWDSGLSSSFDSGSSWDSGSSSSFDSGSSGGFSD